MSLDAEYPPSVKLKQNELKTLRFLYTQPFVTKLFPELAGAAQTYYFNINTPKKLRSSSFNFEAELNILIERKLRRVIIGANVIDIEKTRNQYEYNLVSYSLSICARSKSPLRLLRKFHFDYTIPDQKTNQPVPIFHLQYGGKLSNYLLTLGLSDKRIHPWLSIPRLNHHPITLALLLDIVFCEFRSEQTHRLVERDEWRKLIKENEELIVKPYYEKLNRFVQSNDYNQNCLIRDYCYGK